MDSCPTYADVDWMVFVVLPQESFNVEAVFVALAKQIKGKNAAQAEGPGSVLNQGSKPATDAGACGSC